MKCPDCNSEKYSISNVDPGLMCCENCRAMHSIAWAVGYWYGYCESENNIKKNKEICICKAPMVLEKSYCTICGKDMYDLS